MCCLLEGGEMKGFLGTHLLVGWAGFIIYSRDILEASTLHHPSPLAMKIEMARGAG